jgi:hypothetical protein
VFRVAGNKQELFWTPATDKEASQESFSNLIGSMNSGFQTA